MKWFNWNRKPKMDKKHPKPPKNYDMGGLRYIMRALRDPITGCEWDLQQDFNSIGSYTIEEAYEVMDAIHKRDYNELAEELGDLLLQPIFHAQIAEELGLFDFETVGWNICDKMIKEVITPKVIPPPAITLSPPYQTTNPIAIEDAISAIGKNIELYQTVRIHAFLCFSLICGF